MLSNTVKSSYPRGWCPEPTSSQTYPLLLSCSALSCPCADVALQANFARLQCQLISARIKSKGGRVKSMVDLSQRLEDGIDVGGGGNQDIPCTSQPRMVSLGVLYPLWLQPPLHPDPPEFSVSTGSFWHFGSGNWIFSHYPSSLRMIKTSCYRQCPGLFCSPLLNSASPFSMELPVLSIPFTVNVGDGFCFSG